MHGSFLMRKQNIFGLQTTPKWPFGRCGGRRRFSSAFWIVCHVGPHSAEELSVDSLVRVLCRSGRTSWYVQWAAAHVSRFVLTASDFLLAINARTCVSLLVNWQGRPRKFHSTDRVIGRAAVSNGECFNLLMRSQKGGWTGRWERTTMIRWLCGGLVMINLLLSGSWRLLKWRMTNDDRCSRLSQWLAACHQVVDDWLIHLHR